MEQLIKGKTINGKWYVRPILWAGGWDKNGNLASGNTLYESDNEYDCDVYMMNYKLIENKLLQIMPEMDIIEQIFTSRGMNLKDINHYLNTTNEDILDP